MPKTPYTVKCNGAEGCPSPEEEDKEEDDEEEREEEPGVGEEAASATSCRLEFYRLPFFKKFGCVCSKYYN